MAKLFEIGIPDGLSPLKLDSQGRGSVQYTVKNVSARAIDGRAILVSLPPATPPDPGHPVQKGWIKLDGKPEKHFEINGENTYTVNVAIPPKSQPGTYSFRLDVVSVLKPDEGDSSQAVKFTIAATAEPKTKWGLIAAIIVAVLCVGGVVAWLALKPKVQTTVPDLHGMVPSDATTALAAANLRLDNNVATAVRTAADSGKIVDQNPIAGAPLPANGTVHVTVGAVLVNVPLLIGHSLADAQALLAPMNLSIGQSPNQPNPNFAGGVIFQQTPGPNTSVQTNSSVNVVVTPQTVQVPRVVGMTVIDADTSLGRAGLVRGSVTGDLTAQAVTSQTPAENTPVPIGTQVNLTVPSSPACVPITRCYWDRRTTTIFLANPNVRRLQ